MVLTCLYTLQSRTSAKSCWLSCCLILTLNKPARMQRLFTACFPRLSCCYYPPNTKPSTLLLHAYLTLLTYPPAVYPKSIVMLRLPCLRSGDSAAFVGVSRAAPTELAAAVQEAQASMRLTAVLSCHVCGKISKKTLSMGCICVLHSLFLL